MKTKRLLAKLMIAVCAVVVPSLGILVALGYTWSTELLGLVPFAIVLITTLGLAAFFSWGCVRYGGISVKLASSLPVLPFAVMVVTTLPALMLGFVGPTLLWGIPLVLALIIGRRVALHAL